LGATGEEEKVVPEGGQFAKRKRSNGGSPEGSERKKVEMTGTRRQEAASKTDAKHERKE